MRRVVRIHGVPFSDALLVWTHVASLPFGGPAERIAIMHQIIVDEKLDQGGAFPARAVLLHAPAGPGGAATRHLQMGGHGKAGTDPVADADSLLG